ncbi:type II toxin-antitoxin system VapC family toxin [Rhizobium sp. BR 362]|uniref:type II toxin-antitoxin system VapC family toxin n=1 Tax=Rhizobium sp. BR 362 TaxID=3040670 RepID=UPI002F4299B9
MVIDTSAILAILLKEAEGDEFINRIAADSVRLVSAANVFEASMVIEARYGDAAGGELDMFLLQIDADIIPIDAELADIARRAWRRYGKGRHPAALNFGDCRSYALAVVRNEPLLFKGNDFSQTDILAA